MKTEHTHLHVIVFHHPRLDLAWYVVAAGEFPLIAFESARELASWLQQKQLTLSKRSPPSDIRILGEYHDDPQTAAEELGR